MPGMIPRDLLGHRQAGEAGREERPDRLPGAGDLVADAAVAHQLALSAGCAVPVWPSDADLGRRMRQAARSRTPKPNKVAIAVTKGTTPTRARMMTPATAARGRVARR